MHGFRQAFRQGARSVVGNKSTRMTLFAVGVASGIGLVTLYPSLEVAHASRVDPQALSQAPNHSIQQLAASLIESAGLSFQNVNVGRGRIRGYHTSQYNANTPIEDAFDVRPVLSSDGGSLFGVFDGHSGTGASKFCREELFSYLEWYRHTFGTDVISANPILHADQHFIGYAMEDRRFGDALSGSCYVVTHVKGDTVRTASAGDCRVIVGRRRSADIKSQISSSRKRGNDVPASSLTSPNYATRDFDPIELSVVHQIDLNARERERLLCEHEGETDLLLHSRIKGGLQPTRGLGDGPYKRMEVYNEWPMRTRRPQWHPPYTTAEPDVTQHTLTAQDEFIVMATDGLFEDLSPEAVVEYVGEYLQSPDARKRHKQNCASFLIEKALIAAGESSTGRAKEPSRTLSWVMSLPPGARRRYHDDISVIVVFFDSPDASRYNASDDKPPGSDPPIAPPSLRRTLNRLKAKDMPVISSGGLSFDRITGIVPEVLSTAAQNIRERFGAIQQQHQQQHQRQGVPQLAGVEDVVLGAQTVASLPLSSHTSSSSSSPASSSSSSSSSSAAAMQREMSPTMAQLGSVFVPDRIVSRL